MVRTIDPVRAPRSAIWLPKTDSASRWLIRNPGRHPHGREIKKIRAFGEGYILVPDQATIQLPPLEERSITRDTLLKLGWAARKYMNLTGGGKPRGALETTFF